MILVALFLAVQDPTLIGTWRTVSPGNSGLDTLYVTYDAVQFHYVLIRRLPEARTLRDTVVQVGEVWGRYTLTPLGREGVGLYERPSFRLCQQVERPRRRPPECSTIEVFGNYYAPEFGPPYFWVPEGMPAVPPSTGRPIPRGSGRGGRRSG